LALGAEGADVTDGHWAEFLTSSARENTHFGRAAAARKEPLRGLVFVFFWRAVGKNGN
jgi:hypothetical protein